jgi:O-antigen/teichoic acid export membrane protein
MNLRQRLISASALNVLDYGLKIGVVLVVSPFVIRTLGTDQYGFWVILISMVGYLDLLDLGLAPTGVRF